MSRYGLEFLFNSSFNFSLKCLYCVSLLSKMPLNPLTLNSDQHQFSPNNFHTL